MLKVNLIDVIKYKHFEEGHSARRISREMQISRNTVKRYLNSKKAKNVENTDAIDDKTVQRASPLRDKVEARVRELLKEWDSRTTEKQRITGTKLHRALNKENCGVGVTLVREIFAEIRREKAEVFVPLIHRPGDEAQVDFFEVTLDISGQRGKGWMFVMHLMFSGRAFVWIYEHCDQVSFLDGHVRAFEHFEGLPDRCIYDNLSAAVRRVVAPERELTVLFAALVKHYRFEANFARVGEGHDKGGVEARGKGIRLSCLSPIPRADTLEEACKSLLSELEERATEPRRGSDKRSTLELFTQEEYPRMKMLPGAPFQARKAVPISLSSKSTFIYDTVLYSVPTRMARLAAVAYIGPADILVICRGETIVKTRQRRGGRGVEYRHYLPELAKKPQAVRQVAPELVSELGSPYQKLWELLSDTHGSMEAARILTRILAAIVDHGEEAVKQAVELSLVGDRPNLLGLRLPKRYHPHVVVPESLANIEVEAVRAASYDRLLQIAGAVA